MVDLLFLHNKETTKVKLSDAGLNPDEIDIAALARGEASDDEEEIIGLKGYEIDDTEVRKCLVVFGITASFSFVF